MGQLANTSRQFPSAVSACELWLLICLICERERTSFDFGIGCSFGFGFCGSFFDCRTPRTASVHHLLPVPLARGHEVKLVKDKCRLDIRKYSFSQRRVNESNKLSTDCITASSVKMFKNKLDTYLRTADYT